MWSRGGWYKSALIYQARRSNVRLVCLCFNSGSWYCNICVYVYIYIYIYIYFFFLFFQISIPMYVKICTNDRRRCINIRNVVSEVRKYICLVLTALHSLQEMIISAPFTESVKLNCWTSSFDMKTTSKPSKQSETCSH